MIRNIFIEYGFEKEAIDKVLSYHPVCNFADDTLTSRVQGVFKELLLLGYKKNEVRKMINIHPVLLCYELGTSTKKINDLVKIGYRLEEIRKITKYCPQILGYSMDKIEERISNLLSYGLNKKDVLKMTKYAPSILGEDITLVNNKIKFLKELGFDNTCYMIKKLPALLTYDSESLVGKINNFVSMGYEKQEVIEMIKKNPKLLSYSEKRLKDDFNSVINLDIEKDKVLYIFKQLSSLFGSDIEKTKGKILFFREMGLENIVLEKPRNLIQSIELTYARYNYLKDIGEDITTQDYNKLFIDGKYFKRKFGKSKEELLEMYNYEEYLKERENENGNVL